MAASFSREELELKRTAERTALRQECHVELRHKLLDVAQAQLIALNEHRRTVHEALEEEILKQKLDAIALSGRRLSQVFMNSLVATFVHRIAAAAIQPRKEPDQGLATEDLRSTQDNNADFHLPSGCNLAAISPPIGIIPQALDRFLDTTSHYPPLSHMAAAVEYECAQANVGGGAGLTLEGFPVDCVLKHPLQDGTPGYSAETQLARLVQERVDLDRQVSEERNLFSKRSAYLCECRLAAEKEKDMARTELAAAMLSLVMAEKERSVAASCRAAALDELKRTTPLDDECSRPQGICGADIGVHNVVAPTKTHGYDVPTAGTETPQLHLDTTPHLSLPLSTCPATPTLTLPDSPDEAESNCHSGDSCSMRAASSRDNPICPKVATELGRNDERTDSAAISRSHPGVKDEVVNISEGLENPIGPYIRPPMPLEDMLKCIRCLFGKDKSLKTGNRARAFLGVPWSEIVSFDPDVLVRRGVLGIKEGSTGMASRLRMMTIIESALSNQNDAVSLNGVAAIETETATYLRPVMLIVYSRRGVGETHLFLRELPETLPDLR